MLNRLRNRLNYANIVATVALFMGLGGVGYAATASKNSVRSTSIVDRQVKNRDIALNAITTGRIRNGNVADADLATNAVTSVKIANGTSASPTSPPPPRPRRCTRRVPPRSRSTSPA